MASAQVRKSTVSKPWAPELLAIQQKLEWPEPVQRVQSIAESGVKSLPRKYVRPEPERPRPEDTRVGEQIPVIDLSGLHDERCNKTMEEISKACKEWGFFQVINHGLSPLLLRAALGVSKGFFDLPLVEKQKHANDPRTYVGYGSRTGVQKGAVLDWGDYYYHHFLPLSLREEHKWPSKPEEYRIIMKEYCKGITELFLNLLTVFSLNLGLHPDHLKEACGGEDDIGMCVRINYYPPCPQPDLTFGLSSHSDPGAITFLLQDDISGLQVRKGDHWVSVRPIPNAFVVNLGDQMQILTNGAYRSVEHRAVVNENKERMSIAGFCNPCGKKTIGPIKELLNDSNPAMYRDMTFNEYRMLIRTTGTKGKSYLNSVTANCTK
eukprot:Gb_32334 [translate_table: standard]